MARPSVVTNAISTSPAARFDALFSDFQRSILAYTLRRSASRADAEEAAAETFTIAWRKLASVPAETPLPWLYAVARRVLANQRRAHGRRERLAALLTAREDVATPLHLGDDVDGPAFAALRTLSPADQEVLRLVAWEELGNQEIATVLGISPNAVAIRLHRARARYAAALAGTHGGDGLKYPASSRTSTDVKGTDSAAWTGVAR